MRSIPISLSLSLSEGAVRGFKRGDVRARSAGGGYGERKGSAAVHVGKGHVGVHR